MNGQIFVSFSTIKILCYNCNYLVQPLAIQIFRPVQSSVCVHPPMTAM